MEVQGKIFVVVAVLAVIVAGLYVYLFYIDRKLRRLEKQIREKE
jgi:CcmD family protein